MERILVTGATGQLGREAVKLLKENTAQFAISVLVRDASKAGQILPSGITVHQGDYRNYDSLEKAFKGIDKLFFISTSDLNDRELQHENVLKAAINANIKHVVYTSFQHKNETDNSPIRLIGKVHIYTEKRLVESGITYTILRHAIYTDYLPMILGDQVIDTGTIYFPAGDGRAAFTMRSDLAAGGVAVITGKNHENKIYEFCAEKTYSFEQIAEILTALKGKSIRYVSPSREEYKSALIKAGVPELYAEMYAGNAEGIKQGEFDVSDHTLSDLIGRPTISVEAFLKDVYK